MPSSNYYSAIVDSNFERKGIYDIVKIINKEILHYSSIWINSKKQYIWFVGANAPKGINTIIPPERVPGFTADGKGFVLSCFKSKGIRYIMAVNTDVNNSQNLYIDSRRKLKLCNLNTERFFKSEVFNVAPGDYSLIRL